MLVDDECPLEDLRPIASVGARVHPDPAADRAGDRARELERPQARRTRAVQADGVRRAPARDQQLASSLGRGELAVKSEDERLDTLVCDEQV